MGFLRFLLATNVVAAHTGGTQLFVSLGGQVAVQLFYVVSGFLIALVLHTKYPAGWRGTKTFYFSRYLRIWVPYIGVAIIVFMWMVVMYLIGGQPYGSALYSLKTLQEMDAATVVTAVAANLFVFGQDVGMFLAYDSASGLHWSANSLAEHRPFYSFYILAQTWTLGVELGFYLIAPFLVRRHPVVLVAIIAASVTARILAASIGWTHDPWSYRFLPFELALFFTGCLGAKLYLSLFATSARDDRPLWTLPAAAMPILAVVLWTYRPAFLDHPVLLLACVGLGLPFLFAWTATSRWDNALGALSYPLYLVHYAIIIMISAHPRLVDALGTSFWVIMSLSICASIAVARWLEAPADRYRHRLSATAGEGHAAVAGLAGSPSR